MAAFPGLTFLVVNTSGTMIAVMTPSTNSVGGAERTEAR
jgi:hypothetical protein